MGNGLRTRVKGRVVPLGSETRILPPFRHLHTWCREQVFRRKVGALLFFFLLVLVQSVALCEFLLFRPLMFLMVPPNHTDIPSVRLILSPSHARIWLCLDFPLQLTYSDMFVYDQLRHRQFTFMYCTIMYDDLNPIRLKFLHRDWNFNDLYNSKSRL